MTTNRQNILSFQDIPNIGPAMERDFIKLGLSQPADLIGKDPYMLYDDLCEITATRQDPCVLDTFIAAIKFMQGGPAQMWWEFTAERKAHLKQP